MAGNPSEIREWAQEHSIPDSTLFIMQPTRVSPFARLTVSHLWFTPMRVIVTNDLIVKDARPADILLPQAILNRICQNGGHTPTDLDELRTMTLSKMSR